MSRRTGICPVRYSFVLLACCIAGTLLPLGLLTGCGSSSLVSTPTSNTPSSGGTTPPPGSTTPAPGGTTGATPPSNTGGSTAQFAYVTLNGVSGVGGLQVNSSGTAGPIAGSPFAAPGATLFAARHGQFVFVTTGDFIASTTTIHTYTQDAAGKLTLTSSLTYPHPIGPLALDPSGTHLFGVDSNSGFAVFNVSSSGQLSEVAGSPYVTYSGVGSPLVVAPSGKFIYALGDVGQHDVNVPVIYFFAINPGTGQLMPASGFNFVRATVDQGLAITPDSRYALATNGAQSQLCAYVLDQNSGSPTPIGSDTNAVPAVCIGTGSGADGVAIHPGGRWVAVANALSNNVSVYSFSGGTFTSVGGSPFSSGVQPQHLAFSTDGRYLFVSNYGSGDVSLYSVNSSTGALTPISGSPVQVGSKPQVVVAP